MNLTLLVETNRRKLVLKQARPWVEKYDHIAAPWERMDYEQRFYERAASIPEVAARMPNLIAADREARCVLLEALEDARDFTDLYAGAEIAEQDLRELVIYLAALHSATRGAPDPAFANREMRRLNHEHIFCIPLAVELDLERFEPGLNKAAEQLKRDEAFVSAVRALGERYLADGPCLVHGDYFPGSWLRSGKGVKVIDPEFCFCGDPEFDLGVWIAHLALGRKGRTIAASILDDYDRRAKTRSDRALIARYAATEVMRRLIGVAQLPIAPSNGWRGEMLERARGAMENQKFTDLFE